MQQHQTEQQEGQREGQEQKEGKQKDAPSQQEGSNAEPSHTDDTNTDDPPSRASTTVTDPPSTLSSPSVSTATTVSTPRSSSKLTRRAVRRKGGAAASLSSSSSSAAAASPVAASGSGAVASLPTPLIRPFTGGLAAGFSVEQLKAQREKTHRWIQEEALARRSLRSKHAEETAKKSDMGLKIVLLIWLLLICAIFFHVWRMMSRGVTIRDDGHPSASDMLMGAMMRQKARGYD